MADAGHNLRIKYGLRQDPSPALQQQWAALVEELIRKGVGREEAGRQAAQQTFSDFGQLVYASEGDTLEMLLQRVRDK